MAARRQGLPDQKILPNNEFVPNRKVLFAVELVDPIAQSPVYRGVEVKAAGLRSSPILNKSGRFVWLEEGDRWPGTISVTPEDAPFAKQIAPAPPRPADLAKARSEERLVRITLRPAPVYPLEDGITAIRGRLCEGDEKDPPIAGARVQLAWHDLTSHNWLPPKPRPEDADADGGDPPSPPEPETDKNGEFVVFLRLNPPKPAQPDLENGMLAVRLQFTRDRKNPVTRATPDDFPFLADFNASGNHPPASNGAPQVPKGRIPEGRLLARDLTIGWKELNPILSIEREDQTWHRQITLRQKMCLTPSAQM